MREVEGLAEDSWPGRRAGLWLAVIGATMALLGSAVAEVAPSPPPSGPLEVIRLALWLTELMILLERTGAAVLGVGIVIFVAWEPVLGGLARKLERAADRTATSVTREARDHLER